MTTWKRIPQPLFFQYVPGVAVARFWYEQSESGPWLTVAVRWDKENVHLPGYRLTASVKQGLKHWWETCCIPAELLPDAIELLRAAEEKRSEKGAEK